MSGALHASRKATAKSLASPLRTASYAISSPQPHTGAHCSRWATPVDGLQTGDLGSQDVVRENTCFQGKTLISHSATIYYFTLILKILDIR